MKLALLLIPLVLSFQASRAFDFCGVCKAAIQALESALGSNATKQDVINYLNNLCKDDVPSWLVGICEGALDALADELLNYIKQGLPPQQCCADVGLCGSRVQNPFLAIQAQYEEKPMCVACKGLLGIVSKELTNPDVEGKIQSEVIQVCSLIPNQGEAQMCKTVIQGYFKTLWGQVVKLLSPTTLCDDVGLCKKSGAAQAALYVKFKQAERSTDPWGTVECNFCTMLFNFLEQNLLSPNMQQMMDNELKQVCNDIPNQDYAQKCSAMVDKYGKMLFKELQKLLAPTKVCPMIHMCPSS